MEAVKYVWLFSEGNAKMRDLLGGKGANLAEMTNIGLPVPPGFTITTEACNEYTKLGHLPEGLLEEVSAALAKVEMAIGHTLGDPNNPLLVSVRSGAKFSMPGMMDTVLNLGLNDEIVAGLIKKDGNPRFVLDSYRRLLMMLSDVSFSTPKNKLGKHHFEEIFQELKSEIGVTSDLDVPAEGLEELICRYKNHIVEQHGKPFPQDIHEQFRYAIEAVFKSWNNDRAIVYRRKEHISDGLGTAVNIQAMVFGNMGEDCGTGVAFTRNPSTGEKIMFGEYLMNAQGEDVVAGIRTPIPIAEIERSNPTIYTQFKAVCDTLEQHYKDMQDIEFTIERGKLFILQCRSGKRTGPAAVKIAVDLVHEGVLDKRGAISSINPSLLDQCLHPIIKPGSKHVVMATGLAAGPGAATGIAVFDARRAAELGKGGAGKRVILVRADTNPDDLKGMLAAEGVLTERGGMTSHAALVARGFGIPTVVGCSDIVVDADSRSFRAGSRNVKEGEFISLNGTTGEVIDGTVEVVPAEVTGEFELLLVWADAERKIGIRANADTPEDTALAIRFGAEGLGLVRTEHMFFATDRRPIVQAMILSSTDEERQLHLNQLLEFQRHDFEEIFKALDGRPATIRLIDPPLHEFLPDFESLVERVASGTHAGVDVRADEKLLEKVRALHEINPMMGLRGCRLSIVYPQILRMQTRAIIEGAIAAHNFGVDVAPEIMIPLVSHVNELKLIRHILEPLAHDLLKAAGVSIYYLFGTMIEVPRAAITADQIAEYAAFFSFGTNDLTQMTYGFSRDDSDVFLKPYIAQGVLPHDPFETIDTEGVGELMRIAVQKGRSVRPGIKLGICGEHGGDPASIAFCSELGMDYVSCSPYRVPIARLAAAQAALSGKEDIRDR